MRESCRLMVFRGRPVGSAETVVRASDRIVPPAMPRCRHRRSRPALGYRFPGACDRHAELYLRRRRRAGPKWLFIGPQATVFDAEADQADALPGHQSLPERDQATWQHSRDSSAVWGRKTTGSTDAAYVWPL